MDYCANDYNLLRFQQMAADKLKERQDHRESQ